MKKASRSEGPGSAKEWNQRRRKLFEYVDAEVSRIATKEGRPRAEAERMLLLAGVRHYNEGEELRFRKSELDCGIDRSHNERRAERPEGSVLRLVGKDEAPVAAPPDPAV